MIAILTVLLGILLILGIIIILFSNSIIRTNIIKVESPKLTKDINIIFVSDFHIGMYNKKKELKKIINLINKLDGDYLLIGGDMAGISPLKYYKDEELKEIIDELKINRRYFVGGNHEDYSLSLYNNFNVLRNEIIDLDGNAKLIGLDWKRGECLDYKLDRNNFNVLLSHYPDRILDYSKIDLALGAHSHGNQVNLPFCKFHHKERYTRGMYDLGNNKKLYVNKGLGFSFLKIRFLSCREIVKIELRKCCSNGNN